MRRHASTAAVQAAIACLALTLHSPPSGAQAAEPRCEAPGQEVLTDPAGDQAGGATGANTEFDILSISIAEQNYSATPKFTFTMKVDNLQTLPVNAVWRVRFTLAGVPAGQPSTFLASMNTPAEEGAPTFTYGYIDPVTGSSTTVGDADILSNYDPDGTITIIVNKDLVGNPAPDTTLDAVNGLSQQLAGASGTGITATLDSTSSTATYTTVAAGTCPAAPDGDADGVSDYYDECPGTPAGATVDAAGCPAVAGCVTEATATALARVPFAGETEVDLPVQLDWARAAPDARYGAFVHFFRQGTRAQQDVILKGLGLRRVHDFRRYTTAVYAEGPVAAFRRMAGHPWVMRIEHDAPMRLLDATQSWATRIRLAQERVAEGPYRDANGDILAGKGVTLGIIDGGLFGAHPDFSGRITHNFKIVNPFIAGGTPQYVDVGEGDSENVAGGHGTHVTGIVAGDGRQSDGGYPNADVAPWAPGTFTSASPQANIIHWAHGVGLLIVSANVAYRHMLDNLTLPTFATLRAVNNSYGEIEAGTPYDPNDAGKQMIKQIVGCGINMVFAAGNDGGDGSADMTSSYCKDPTPGVICVASYNDQGTGALDAPLSGFSSRGKQGVPSEYPDIAAPGDLSTSACAQATPTQAVCTGGDDNAAETEWQPWYGTISGTSMATPNIVGVIGALAQAKPSLTPAEIEQLLQRTARRIGGGYEPDPQLEGSTIHFGYGAGLVDMKAALDELALDPSLGITKAGLLPTEEEWTVFEGDTEPDITEEAANAVKLTMQNFNLDGPGVMYRLTVGDAADFSSPALQYRLEQNARGVPTRTTIVATPDGVAVAETGENNTAIATFVERVDNVISFFVPYAQLGYPPINEPIHNIRVVVSNDVGALDYAPSPDAPVATAAVQPMFGRAFTTRLAPGTVPPSSERACELPGLTRVVSGPGTTGDSSQTGMDDLRRLWLAEPADMPGKLVMTMKVDNLNPAPIPNYRWYVYFNTPVRTDVEAQFVAMDTVPPGSSAAPRFIRGFRETVPAPGTSGVGVFTVEGDLPDSSYDTDGIITLVLDKAQFGLDTGMAVTSIAAWVRQTSNGQNGAGLSVDSAAALEPYVLVGNLPCPALPIPVANLLTDISLGVAPVTVTFDASGSTPGDDTTEIASYSFDFGDGSEPVTQAEPTTEHTYTMPGTYAATLTVTDNAGTQSSNVAEVLVEVLDGTPGTLDGDGPGNNRLGGALPGTAVLLLGLLAALRRSRIAAGLLGLLVATSAAALPERASTDRSVALSRLQANAGGELRRHADARTAYSMLRAEHGHTLLADGGAGTPAERARLFLSLYGAALGVSDPATELRLQRVSRDMAGNSHVHLEQVHDGVPVFGARLIVHLNDAGVTGVNGVFVPGLKRMPATRLPLERLRAAALAYARKSGRAADLRIDSGRFVVYPIGLLNGHFSRPRLAYEALVTGARDARDRVFIDAGTGVGLNRISRVHTVLNREIYTPDQSVPPTYDEQASTLTIPAGPADPPLINDPGHNSTDFSDDGSGTPPADNLWIFAGGTYALYNNMFGRAGYDACDGNGQCQPDTPAPAWAPDRPDDYVGQLQKSVYLINDNCPNAYWNGDSTNYCPGFDADDVVSHEWSHAYTQYTHGLIYQYQSGALNESYSDIFGEAYDLLNHLEGPLGSLTLEEHKYYEEFGSRWVVGEDLSEEAAALLLRDMWKPDDFPAANPGKATSENYTCGSGDNGGVHANSSVPNHAFAMLVDGTAGQGPEGTSGFERDSYNGQSFAGIGMVKALHIYFHAEANYQTPTTDFPQHAEALRASCQDLKGVTLKDPTGADSAEIITQGDCDVLDQAMLATEMDLGTPCPYIPVLQQNPPALCEGANTIFIEDWESGEDGWSRTSTGVFADWEDDSRDLRDFVLDATLPAGRAGTAALARNIPLGEPGGGDCQPGSEDYSGEFTYDGPEVTIPEGATDLQLRFDHYVATEATFDGGQLEVSVNGGAFALVPQGNYTFNPPNSNLDEAPPVGLNTNPNAGEAAWNGTDINAPSGSPPANWGTTIVNLSGIATPGDTVQLRLTFSQDGCNGVEGWYADDLHLYSCPALDAPTLALGADYEDPDIDGTYTLEWERPANAVGPETLQISTTSCVPMVSEDAEGGFGQWTVTRSDPFISPNWESSNAQPNHGSTTFWANPTSEQETQNSSAALTFTQPIAIPASGETFMRFSEWYFNEPDDQGLVEISIDDGASWTTVYSNVRAGLTEDGAAALGAEGLVARELDLTGYAGQTIRLRFNFVLGESNFFFYTQYGWHVDDIALVNDDWGDLLTTEATSHTLSGQTDGTACYRVLTTYDVSGQAVPSRFSTVVPATVALDINQLPIAVAGADRLIDEETGGTLDGSGSSDPDGDALTYAWTQLSGPDVALTGADTATPAFTAPEVCTDTLAVLQLTVTDPEGLAATDQLTLTINNLGQRPVADAGSDFKVFEGAGAMLSAAGTTDPDCEPLSYSWLQLSGPTVTLTGADTATPSFTAPAVEGDTLMRFRVLVEDPDGNQSADLVDVTVSNAIGNARVGALGLGQTLTLALAGVAALMRRRRRDAQVSSRA